MSINIDEAVGSLLRARLGHHTVQPITESVPGLTLEEADAVRGALERALVLRGERVIGWWC